MIGWAYTHKRITTRGKRETMEFISMEDLTGTFEVTVFPTVYRRHAPQLHGHGPFRVTGRVERDHGVCMLTAERIETLPGIACRTPVERAG
jgi:DNA polymerase III alpha subunit